MKQFSKFAALAAATMLASLFFGACTPPATETPAPTPEEPADTSVYSLTTKTAACNLLLGDEMYSTAQATFVAGKDRKKVESPEITYTIADPAIAAVDEAGVVTPKAYGRTELVAMFHDASARVPVNVFERTTAENVNTFDETYINRYGRQYFSEDGALNVDHVASGFEVAFLGDSLTVDLDVTCDKEGNTVFDVYAHIYLDGDTEGEFVKLESGAFTVAEGLGEGIHTARVLKSSEIDRGKFAVKGFSAEEFLRMPEKSDLKIEFIGDSITAGYGNRVVGGNWSVENSDACISYAALTGMRLDADFSVIALSGICLNVSVYGILNMTEMHSYLSNRNPVPYTYDADMDAVVLALGTNDASYIDKNTSYRHQFPDDYAAFLNHLREIYPHAYVVCIYGMMGANTFVESGIQEALETVGDPKMSYLSFRKNDMGAGAHPGGDAHKLYADQLTEYLRGLLG